MCACATTKSSNWPMFGVRSKIRRSLKVSIPNNNTNNNNKDKVSLVSVAEHSVRDLCNIPRTTERLQYDREEERIRTKLRLRLHSSSSLALALLSSDQSDAPAEDRDDVPSASSKRKRVNFREAVVVVPVPLRHEHSRELRNKLWSGSRELSQNARRNNYEFAAEHYDWRLVRNEDEMYTCAVTGELIHPIHVEGKPHFNIIGRNGSEGESP